MSATKISENISNILNCYFSTCRKLNLLLVNSTYCIIPALLKQSTDQSTLQVLLLCSNRHTNLQKKQLEKKKKKISNVYVIDGTSFDECFLFQVVTGRHYFWQKFVLTLRFFQPPYCCFLWNKYIERSPYFTNFISTVQCS